MDRIGVAVPGKEPPRELKPYIPQTLFEESEDNVDDDTEDRMRLPMSNVEIKFSFIDDDDDNGITF